MPFDSKEYSTLARRLGARLGHDGEHWTQGGLLVEGRVCLIGALVLETGHYTPQSLRKALRTEDDGEAVYGCAGRLPEAQILARACAEINPGVDGSHCTARIFGTNDRAKDFSVIRRVLDRMHELEITALVKASP